MARRKVDGFTLVELLTVIVIFSILLLTFHGWSAGRASRLHGWQLAAVTSTAAALGLVMVVLKDLVLIHLH